MKLDLGFYKGKKVLVTGHTGFKGSWMSVMLANAGADVIGYSINDGEESRLFNLCGVKDEITHIKGDVRDLEHLVSAFNEYKPEIVIHMAAQPLVRESYKDPVNTYSTNVMGTVNICEAVRQTSTVKSFLNVTTDKVYENKEQDRGFREDEPLDGYDPYSNSKSCSELVTHSYNSSFLKEAGVAVSTARAGNVIGGGDYASDRIIPDCVRAAVNDDEIIVRNPYSTRPYQHVLEPVYAYLLIAQAQYFESNYASWYNVGPDDNDCIKTGDLVEMFIKHWGEGIRWVNKYDGGPHEANFLKLDCTKLKTTFGWSPLWNIDTAVKKAVDWYKGWKTGEDVRKVMDRQIDEYIKGKDSSD